jgi:hypothetical protein
MVISGLVVVYGAFPFLGLQSLVELAQTSRAPQIFKVLNCLI